MKIKPLDLTASTTVAIPVTEAVRRTTNWREFMASNLDASVDVNMIPKAVYMSKADIVAMYNALTDDIVGARAYFTLDSTAAEAVKNVVTFCMVMVKQCDDKRCGEDVIYLPNSSNGVGDGDDDSGIYDYTKPCPDYCDSDSPLFNGDKP